MKKSARKILSLMLTLVLICALALTAFAVNTERPIESTSRVYDYGQIIMTQTIEGYDKYASAVITFCYEDGNPVPYNYISKSGGDIDYQYCPEDHIHPSTYVEDSQTFPYVQHTGPKVSVSIDELANGYMMVDASMFFSAVFTVSNGTMYHNRPNVIYVAII
jgi:hypothetical protein